VVLVIEFVLRGKDPEIRLKEIMKFLKTQFVTEPTLKTFFSDEEIEYLKSKGLMKVEVYIMNNRRWYV
jgi:hypothetical protein